MCRSLLIAGFIAWVVLSASGTVGASAEVGGDPWSVDVDVAWQQSKASNRLLVLVASTHDCLYCEQLKATTLKDHLVRAELEKSFVVAAVKDSDHPTLLRKLQVESFPTTVVISPDGRVMDKIEGYLPPEKFHARLTSILRVASRTAAGSR